MRCRLVGLLFFAFCLSAVSCSDGWTPAKAKGTLVGGGASFPAPLYEKWIAAYHKAHPESRVVYQAVGSGAGIELFTEGKVDFGASDAAMTDAQINKVKGGVQLFPMAAGSVVLAYNLPDISAPLKLSREVYAGIFLGKITNWSDPMIAADNKDVKLPDLKIATVHRSGASGTTYVFTKHLAAINDTWKKGPGSGLNVQWPVGVRAMGNDGIADFVKQTPGAIGYLGYGSALKHKLALASLQNKEGDFVPPSLKSGAAALASVKLDDDLRTWVPDPDGKGSYPIVTFTWILTRRQQPDAASAALLKNFLRYALTDGQNESSELGYIPLPPSIVEKVLQKVEAIGS